MKHDVRTELRRYVREAGSQRKAADALGITQAHVSDILTGRRNAGARLLAKLGLKRVVQYEAR